MVPRSALNVGPVYDRRSTIAAENHYAGKRDKLTMAILEEVDLYD